MRHCVVYVHKRNYCSINERNYLGPWEHREEKEIKLGYTFTIIYYLQLDLHRLLGVEREKIKY